MIHVMQPVGNERNLQRSRKLFLALQTGYQVFTGIAHPSGHIDKCQNITLQILVAGQPVQGFQINVDTLVLEFITATGSDNQCFVGQFSTQKLVRQIQHSLTGFLTTCNKRIPFGHKVILKAVHQNHICRLVKQFTTFIVGDFTDCCKTINMMRSLFFNGML